MANSEKPQSNEPQDFFDKPKNIQWILRIFYGLCVLLVLLDFFIHRHIETAIEKVPAFYAIYGFVACVILVLIATQMRKFLMRSEDYFSNEDNSETHGSETHALETDKEEQS